MNKNIHVTYAWFHLLAMLLGSRQHWLNLFVFLFSLSFFARKANGDTNWYRLNAKVSIANYSNHNENEKFSTFFLLHRSTIIEQRMKSVHLNNRHCLQNTSCQQIFAVVWSLFSGYVRVRVIRFALNGWRMIWIFIRIVDFESMLFSEFRLFAIILHLHAKYLE